MADQFDIIGFGNRPLDAVWSKRAAGTHEFRTSPARSVAAAGAAALAALLLLALMVSLVENVEYSLTVGWSAAAPALFGLLLLVSAFCTMVWLAALAVRSLLRAGPEISFDRKRVVVRTGEGPVALPWSTTFAEVGTFFVSLRTRIARVDDQPVNVVVPVFLLEGGASAVQAAIDAVDGGRSERRALRSGPTRNAG